MAWHENGGLRDLWRRMDPRTRHSVLRLVLLANVATLIFALAEIAEHRGDAATASHAVFYGLLALSVTLSVVSFFLPRYPLVATRIGARIIASGLPLGVVCVVIFDLL